MCLYIMYNILLSYNFKIFSLSRTIVPKMYYTDRTRIWNSVSFLL